MTDEDEIWVLGRKNTNADESFLWKERIPSISDADVVIIDGDTLPLTSNDVLSGIDEIQKELHDKISSGGFVILIYTNNILNITKNEPESSTIPNSKKKHVQSILPCTIEATRVSKAKKLRYANDSIFVNYLKHVKDFSYNITNVAGYILIDEMEITDNSDRVLGGNYTPRRAITEGELIILPPVTDISIDEGIDKIIAIYKKEYSETRPSWVESLDLPGLDDVTSELKKLKNQKTELVKEIIEKTNQREDILKFTALLFAKGKQLEKVVMESFIRLGFNEIKRGRERNNEDWRIETKFIRDVKYGVIEVKGRDKKTLQSDIVQCNTWVDDYLKMSRPVKTKGIFISNQFIHEKYPDSTDKRKKYEPNELTYSKSREICIIPSCVLFEAIRRILDGEKPDRDKIEQRLFNTNGVLEEIL